MEYLIQFIKAYFIAVLGPIFWYADQTKYWPDKLTIGIPLAAMVILYLLLPRWLLLTVGLIVTIPCMSFLGACIWMFAVKGYGRGRR